MKRVVGERRARRLQHEQRRRRRVQRARVRRGKQLAAILEHRRQIEADVRRRGLRPSLDPDRVHIVIPECLSLRDNYAETMAAVMLLRHAVLNRHLPVMLHFENVKRLEPAATLMLVAEIYRCKHLRPYRGGMVVNGTYPENADVLLQLHEMGFFRLIGVDNSDHIPESQDREGRPYFVRFSTFTSVQPTLAARFCDLVIAGAFNMSPVAKRRMVGALKEAMGNAVEHAYKAAGDYQAMPRRWWLAGYVNPTDGEMMVMLYDQGVGVPNTLDPTLYDHVTSRIKTRSWRLSDGHMIAAATELHRTSTGQRGRGKGFRDMKRFINECDDGELRVLSNRGAYHYMKSDETISDESLSLSGTLVEWRVRHGQAVDF